MQYPFRSTLESAGAAGSTNEWSWICSWMVEAINSDLSMTVWRQDDPKPFMVKETGVPASLELLAIIAMCGLYVNDVSHLNRAAAEAEYASWIVDVIFTAA